MGVGSILREPHFWLRVAQVRLLQCQWKMLMKPSWSLACGHLRRCRLRTRRPRRFLSMPSSSPICLQVAVGIATFSALAQFCGYGLANLAVSS